MSPEKWTTSLTAMQAKRKRLLEDKEKKQQKMKMTILRFERTFLNLYNVPHPPPVAKKCQEASDRVDALLTYIAAQSEVPELTLNQWSCDWIMSFAEAPVCIDESMGIWMKLDRLYSDAKQMELQFHIFSEQSSTSQLKRWANDIYQKFLYEREASFTGQQLFLFEAKSALDGLSASGGARMQMAMDASSKITAEDIELRSYEHKRQLIARVKGTPVQFIQRPFITNKRFENLFGPAVDTIERRLAFFQNHEDIYNERGIPYRFGALISGMPGCGKTSVIQALAARTERHIILINFDHIVTAERMRDLFYSDTLHVQTENNGPSVPVRIPINKRLYVLEDIDALGSVVLERDDVNHGFKSYGSFGSIPEELTLSDILNVFDGNLQNQGRVMVVTTNFAEKLDRALVRAGRFDCVCVFDLADRNTIADAFTFFFAHMKEDNTVAEGLSRLRSEMPEDARMSMADVHSIFFNSFEHPGHAAKAIVEKSMREVAAAKKNEK